MARATSCAKHFSSYSGATRTKTGNVSMYPKSFSRFEQAVSKTMDVEFVRRNCHGLIMAKLEKMSSAATTFKVIKNSTGTISGS